MGTAERIRLPDDCTVGYIVEALLGVPLIRSGLFHSHLENLQQVPASELQEQVRPPGWLGGRGGGEWGSLWKLQGQRRPPRPPKVPAGTDPRRPSYPPSLCLCLLGLSLHQWALLTIVFPTLFFGCVERGGGRGGVVPRSSLAFLFGLRGIGRAGPSFRATRPALGRGGAGAPPGITLPLSTQVTLSYGMFENKRNAVHMKGPFSVEADPSR